MSELETEIVQLSYVDVPNAVSALQSLGVTTLQKDTKVPDDLSFAELPLVIELPGPTPESRGLVGKGGGERAGEFGSTVVRSGNVELSPDTITSPTTRLLVMFHPAHPDQFSHVRRLLDEVVDRPARQIFVEALVVELDAANIESLGIEWAGQDNHFSLALGNLAPGVLSQGFTIDGTAIKSQDLATDWSAIIRALIIEGKAEILSRPSVLTLDDRQATIFVGQDVPIATSQEGISGDSSKIAFDFKYLPLGITLNIRPRVSEDSREISLLIDTAVSQRVPGADLVLRDENDTILASAPTVSTRRVQTYARIQNNTPFIIGGLVSRNKTEFYKKIPVLGDIPLLGMFFRTKDFSEIRSEVIIVLTPYVIPEKFHLSRALAESDVVDNEDSQLLRKSYRIQKDDIVDVSFIYGNHQFLKYANLAQTVIRANFRKSYVEPFASFAKGRIPAGASARATHRLQRVAAPRDREGYRPRDVPGALRVRQQWLPDGYHRRPRGVAESRRGPR